MEFYIGVGFHPHQQTVAWGELEIGEIKTCELLHNPVMVKAFYAALPPGIVGIEAFSQAPWFEAILQETGHTLRVGNPTHCEIWLALPLPSRGAEVWRNGLQL